MADQDDIDKLPLGGMVKRDCLGNYTRNWRLGCRSYPTAYLKTRYKNRRYEVVAENVHQHCIDISRGETTGTLSFEGCTPQSKVDRLKKWAMTNPISFMQKFFPEVLAEEEEEDEHGGEDDGNAPSHSEEEEEEEEIDEEEEEEDDGSSAAASTGTGQSVEDREIPADAVDGDGAGAGDADTDAEE